MPPTFHNTLCQVKPGFYIQFEERFNEEGDTYVVGYFGPYDSLERCQAGMSEMEREHCSIIRA